MVRHSLNYVSWKPRKVAAVDLKTIYGAATADEAQIRLGEFDDKWGADYPTIVKSWRSNWARITQFFDCQFESRRIICTTNVTESLNMNLCKITKNRGYSPAITPCSNCSIWSRPTSARSGQCQSEPGKLY